MHRIVLLGPAEEVKLEPGRLHVTFVRDQAQEVTPELQAELVARGRVPAEEGYKGPLRPVEGDLAPHRLMTMEEAARAGEQLWADPDDFSQAVRNQPSTDVVGGES